MATTRPRIYLAMPLTEEARAALEAACEVMVYQGTGLVGREELARAMAEVDGMLVPATLPIDNALIDGAPRLRVISNFGVGFDNVDAAYATRRGIVFCHTPQVVTEAVADLTLALILMITRRLHEAIDFVRQGRWTLTGRMGPGHDLGGKTLAIFGLGRIGQAVARRAPAFGLRVIYHDLQRNTEAEMSGLARYVERETLFREADIVSIHTNLTTDSRRCVGERELSWLKPSAWLINTARGPVVDQPALVAALQGGRLAGAALDVTDPEPPAPDDPILSLPNVIVLPHIGTATVETRAAMADLAARNLVMALRGERPPCMVNPEAWDRRG